MSDVETRLTKVEIKTSQNSTWISGHEGQCGERYAEIRDEQKKVNHSMEEMNRKIDGIYTILWSTGKTLLLLLISLAAWLFAKLQGWA